MRSYRGQRKSCKIVPFKTYIKTKNMGLENYLEIISFDSRLQLRCLDTIAERSKTATVNQSV